jgi:hypothetical protein
MRLAQVGTGESIGFEAVGRTLELMDGDQVKVALATLAVWPSNGDGQAMLVGGATGVLRVLSDDDLVGLPRKEIAGSAIEPGERAHLIEVADVLMLAVSDVDFVGGSYRDGVLGLQVGPVLIQITNDAEASRA